MSSDEELMATEVTEFQRSKGWSQSSCDVLEQNLSDTFLIDFFFFSRKGEEILWVTYSWVHTVEKKYIQTVLTNDLGTIGA